METEKPTIEENTHREVSNPTGRSKCPKEDQISISDRSEQQTRSAVESIPGQNERGDYARIEGRRQDVSDPASERESGSPYTSSYVTSGSYLSASSLTTSYNKGFREMRGCLPHLKNIFVAPRMTFNTGAVFISENDSGAGWRPPVPQSAAPGSLFAQLDWVDTVMLTYNVDRYKSTLVCAVDLTPRTIDHVGTAFDLWPEIFEEHLNQSGYRGSYDDEAPDTWYTKQLPKDYISVRWFSPVLRSKKLTFSTADRAKLVEGQSLWYIQVDEEDDTSPPRAARGGFNFYGAEAKRYERLTPGSNIFRQEKPLSTDPNDDVNAMTTMNRSESARAQTVPVAWEQRATCFWRKRGYHNDLLLLLDPTPRIHNQPDRSIGVRDNQKIELIARRASPRLPPMARTRDVPARDLDKYMAAVHPAEEEISAWLSHFQSRGEPSQPLMAVFEVIRIDSENLLGRLEKSLDEIVGSSSSKPLIESRLSHWQQLLIWAQLELPRLDASLDAFVDFAKGNALINPQVDARLETLKKNIKRTSDRTVVVQQSLRAELSILESEKGIAEAESVTRLTELAFIFIPLSFAAGVFSIQVKEFQDTPPPVWAFIITALLLVTAAYCLRLIQRSVSVNRAISSLGTEMRTTYRITGDGPLSTRVVLRFLLARLSRAIRWGIAKLWPIGVGTAIYVPLVFEMWTRAGESSLAIAMIVLFSIFAGVVVFVVLLYTLNVSVPVPSKESLGLTKARRWARRSVSIVSMYYSSDSQASV